MVVLSVGRGVDLYIRESGRCLGRSEGCVMGWIAEFLVFLLCVCVFAWMRLGRRGEGCIDVVALEMRGEVLERESGIHAVVVDTRKGGFVYTPVWL